LSGASVRHFSPFGDGTQSGKLIAQTQRCDRRSGCARSNSEGSRTTTRAHALFKFGVVGLSTSSYRLFQPLRRRMFHRSAVSFDRRSVAMAAVVRPKRQKTAWPEGPERTAGSFGLSKTPGMDCGATGPPQAKLAPAVFFSRRNFRVEQLSN